MPLFADCFNEESNEETSIICDPNGKQYISKEVAQYSDFINLEDTDAIYGSTFSMMIKEAFRANKHFIVAKLKSRGVDKFITEDCPASYDEDFEIENLLKQEGEIICNYFNVYSIIKLIFRKKGDDFVGRFHPEFAITSINPLTNSRLIGEVEFYFVENPYLKISDPDARYPVGKTLSLKGVKGIFMGSDYNFIFSS